MRRTRGNVSKHFHVTRDSYLALNTLYSYIYIYIEVKYEKNRGSLKTSETK